jgi:ADP-ribosylglycohydrolase
MICIFSRIILPVLVQGDNVRTIEEYGSARRFYQPENGSSCGCLAASRFSDDPQRTAFLNLEAYVIDRMKISPRGVEIFF